MTPFTFLDRAFTIRFYEDEPVEVSLRLGDELEDKLQAAVAHYDEPRTLQEDIWNLERLLGKDSADRLLARAETVDRLTVLELLSYAVRSCRAEQEKKLLALAGDSTCGDCRTA